MKPLISEKSPARKLSARKIAAFKELARRVDAQEAESIKARGQAVFHRHGIAREIVARLKTRRIERGVSLAELAARTGIAKPNLSRLENSERSSPTLETLHRYAQALGMSVRVELN